MPNSFDRAIADPNFICAAGRMLFAPPLILAARCAAGVIGISEYSSCASEH